jgi:hypothetical protein
MVAPFAGGPSDGQGNWNDGQPRYDPHAQSGGQDTRGAMSSSRQLYNTHTPPPDLVGQNYAYQDTGDRERSRQNPQAMDRHVGDRDLPPSTISAPGGERPKAQGTNGTRRPSGSRICGKCGEPLAGQFVRALDNTYHLDCFTCHVSTYPFANSLAAIAYTCRNAAKSSPRNSSPCQTRVLTSTPSARQTISDALI